MKLCGHGFSNMDAIDCPMCNRDPQMERLDKLERIIWEACDWMNRIGKAHGDIFVGVSERLMNAWIEYRNQTNGKNTRI